MWNRLRLQLRIAKPKRYYVLKIVPLFIFITIFLLGVSLGIADPGSSPPVPD
ncbi:MAG: hypothetical protein ACFFC6_01460 [Promethearchaeota archaeon]